MQNNESESNDARLNRIQKLSRILKWCVLLYMIAPLSFLPLLLRPTADLPGSIKIYEHAYDSVRDVPAYMIVAMVIGVSIYLSGVIAFYRLLSLYEKGIIFSAANVLQMKRVGGSLVGYGAVSFFTGILFTGINFPYTFIQLLSPWIVVGTTIYIIAWIMDEGRKIQEEQALTV